MEECSDDEVRINICSTVLPSLSVLSTFMYFFLPFICHFVSPFSQQ